MNWQEAFNKIKPVEPLSRYDLQLIEKLRRELSLTWYYESIVGMKLRQQGKVYVGKCPRKYHNHDSAGEEFAIDPTRNTWHCYGTKCQSHHPNGDVVDLHHELFFPFSKQEAIQDLFQFVPEHSAEFNSEFDQQIPKWDKTKANWGTKRNRATVQKEKRKVGDERKLKEVRKKEKGVDKAYILSQSPVRIDSYSEEEFAWEIHSRLWQPTDVRCIQKTDRDKYPILMREEELTRWLNGFGKTLLDFTYMTCSTYKNGSSSGGRRQLVNVLNRCYYCFESDTLSPEDQLKVISHLAELLPLVVITDSGRISWHAYYCVNAANMEQLDAFASEAHDLFADTRTLEPNALCRLPFGIRTHDKGILLPREHWKRQEVIYFDPGSITFEESSERTP